MRTASAFARINQNSPRTCRRWSRPNVCFPVPVARRSLHVVDHKDFDGLGAPFELDSKLSRKAVDNTGRFSNSARNASLETPSGIRGTSVFQSNLTSNCPDKPVRSTTGRSVRRSIRLIKLPLSHRSPVAL